MACPYWNTHEASPGEPMAFADTQALQLYQQIQRHGWEMVQSLRHWTMTLQEAEGLLVRLDWLTEHLPGILQTFYGTKGQ